LENKRAGKKWRGLGEEIFCPRAEAKHRRPVRSEQKPAKKFSFHFRRKNPARAKEKQRKLFCWLASVSERRRGGAVNFFQNGFGFGLINAPEFDFHIFCRQNPRRDAQRQREIMARRAKRGSPNASSKSLAILSICFAQKRIFAIIELRPQINDCLF